MGSPCRAAARSAAIALDAAFLVLGVTILLITILAAANPPPRDIAPDPVQTYHAFVATICVLVIFSLAVISLCSLGIASIIASSSFFLSLNILGQCGLLAAQFVALIFTLSVRSRLHVRLLEEWADRDSSCTIKASPSPETFASLQTICSPLRRFRKSETMFIWAFFGIFLLQLILLITSSVVCERLSYEERLREYENRVRDPEDEED